MRDAGNQTIETERLLLRPFEEKDAEDMLRNWAGDPDIQNEYGEPVYTDITQVSELLRMYTDPESPKSRYRWAIIAKDSGENIGQIAFCKVWEDCSTAEIEYCIGKSFWGHGSKPITERLTESREECLKNHKCISPIQYSALSVRGKFQRERSVTVSKKTNTIIERSCLL